ncbi:MAG: nucleoside recognition domain-containing protein [Planctomycetota bacterium]
MLNRIWFWLLLIGIAYGFAKGAYQDVTRVAAEDASLDETSAASALDLPVNKSKETAAAVVVVKEASPAESPGLVGAGIRLNRAIFDSAELSVKICIGLIGVMALWLGLLKVADDAGLVATVARWLRPLMRWLFPEVPDGHPAQGAILMNLSANMLGLDNAATPMGLKAMRELQTLNPSEDTATNSMATFLSLNTSSVTLIPFTIIGYRALAESKDPMEPFVAITLTTLVSTIVAVIAARWLSRLPKFAATNPVEQESQGGAE